MLDEKDKYEGNHPLAIFRAQESYESLKRALEDIISEVQHLSYITIDSEVYEIEYFLGGNRKLLAIVTSKLTVHVCKGMCDLDKKYTSILQV